MRNRLPWRWQLAALPLLLAAIWFSNLRETPPLAPQPAPEARNANAALYQVIAQNRCRLPTTSPSAVNTRRTRAAASSTGRTATPAGVMLTAGWSCAASGISENQPTKKTGIKPVFL